MCKYANQINARENGANSSESSTNGRRTGIPASVNIYLNDCERCTIRAVRWPRGRRYIIQQTLRARTIGVFALCTSFPRVKAREVSLTFTRVGCRHVTEARMPLDPIKLEIRGLRRHNWTERQWQRSWFLAPFQSFLKQQSVTLVTCSKSRSSLAEKLPRSVSFEAFHFNAEIVRVRSRRGKYTFCRSCGLQRNS